MVVKMIFVPSPIFGIVDDIIPDATRGVGTTGRSSLGSPSTIIALSNGNGVNFSILAKPFCNTDFKSRLMAPMDVGIIF